MTAVFMHPNQRSRSAQGNVRKHKIRKPPPKYGCLYGLPWVLQEATSAGKGISCRDQHWEPGWITASPSAWYLCYALFIVMR